MGARENLAAGTPADQLITARSEPFTAAADSADAMRELLLDVRHALEFIEVEWDGSAADAFREVFSFQPERFREAAMRFETVSESLRIYAAALDFARREAEIAHTLYHLAMAALPQQVGTPVPYAHGYVDPNATTPEVEYAVAKLDAAYQQLATADEVARTTIQGCASNHEARAQAEYGPVADVRRPNNPFWNTLVGGLRGIGDTALFAAAGMTANQDIWRHGSIGLDWLEARSSANRGPSYWTAAIGVGFLLPGGQARSSGRILGFLPWRRGQPKTLSHQRALTSLNSAAQVHARVAGGVSLVGPGSLSTDAVSMLRSATPELITPPVHWSAQSTERWIDFHRAHPATALPISGGNETAAVFQQHNLGRTESLISTADGTAYVKSDTVGILPGGAVAIDAKFVASPGMASSGLEGTVAEPRIQAIIDARISSELARYAAVINDPTNPLDTMRIVTNSDAAAAHVGQLAARVAAGVNFEIVVVPQ